MADLADLIQKAAYLEHGGGKPSDLEKVNAISSSVGNLGDTGMNIIKERLAMKKASLENQKLYKEVHPPEVSVETPLSPAEQAVENAKAASLLKQKFDEYTKAQQNAMSVYDKQVNEREANRQKYLSQYPETSPTPTAPGAIVVSSRPTSIADYWNPKTGDVSSLPSDEVKDESGNVVKPAYIPRYNNITKTVTGQKQALRGSITEGDLAAQGLGKLPEPPKSNFVPPPEATARTTRSVSFDPKEYKDYAEGLFNAAKAKAAVGQVPVNPNTGEIHNVFQEGDMFMSPAEAGKFGRVRIAFAPAPVMSEEDALSAGKVAKNTKIVKLPKLFPVKGLSPEAQSAARAAGFTDFVTEPQATILGQANPVRPASSEDIKDVASIGNIQDNMNKLERLSAETNYKGIGVGAHQLNTLGQYIPIEAFATDPKITEQYRILNQINNQLIYLYSGKQINEQEYIRLKQTFPDPNLNITSFKSRLVGFRESFNDIAGRREAGIKGAGRRITTGINPADSANNLPGDINKPKVYKTEMDVGFALRNGEITRDEAKNILTTQFKNKGFK